MDQRASIPQLCSDLLMEEMEGGVSEARLRGTALGSESKRDSFTLYTGILERRERERGRERPSRCSHEYLHV